MISNKIGKLNDILLILYINIIFDAHIILYSQNAAYALRMVTIVFALSVIICPRLLKSISALELKASPETFDKKENKKYRALFFFVPFFCFLVLYLIYYPGGFSADSIVQYSQTLSGSYNDWHPVIHTLIAYKLPLLLTGGWIGAPALFQLTEFSLAIMYFTSTLTEYTDKKYSLLTLAFILLNPETIGISMYVWKDSAFTIGAMILTSICIKIYFTNGKWVNNYLNLILLSLILALTTLVRHNGVLYTLPLMFALFVIIKKKKAILILVCFILVVTGIKFPIYSALKVEEPGQRQVEMLGVPLNVIATVVSGDPEALDKNTKEDIYKIAPKEVFNKEYKAGDFNTVKNHENTDLDIIEEYGTKKIIDITIKCFKASPALAVKGLLKILTQSVTVIDSYYHYNNPGIAENSFGISQKGLNFLSPFIMVYSLLVGTLLPHLFQYIGAMHLILIVMFLSKCSFKKKNDLRVLLIILPVFIFNFATTLLLTSIFDVMRFFYYTFTVTPMLLALIINKDKKYSERK